MLKLTVFTAMFLLPVAGITAFFVKKFVENARRNIKSGNRRLRGILIGLLFFLLILGGIQLFIAITLIMFDINTQWIPKWVFLINIILLFAYFIFILPIAYGLGPVVATSGIGSKKMFNTVIDENKNNNEEKSIP